MADETTDIPTVPPAVPPTPPDEGFLHSLATAVGIDPEAVKSTAKAIWSDPVQAAKTIGGAQADEFVEAAKHPVKTARLALQGVISSITNPEAQATARDRFNEPGFVNKLQGAEEYVTSGLPMVGGGVVKSEEQAGAGNLPGATGTLTGVIAPLLAGEAAELPEKVADTIHEAGARARENMAARRESRIQEAKTGKVITIEPQKALGEPAKQLGAAPEAPAPAADGSSTAVPPDHTTFDSVGGIEVKAPDLVSADKIAPTIEHEPIGDSAGLVKLMDGGKEVGRARYTIPQEENPDTAAITAAHVEPTYRGQQHAQALYLRAADELRARGISKMTSDLQGTTTMDAARVWDALAAKGYPVTKIPSKPGSPGYTMDLTKPQAEPAPPEPQFEQALAGRGQLPGQTVNMAEAYGDTGQYIGGLKSPAPNRFLAPIPKKLKQTATAADNMNDPDTRFNAARHEAAHSVISEMLTPGSVNSTGLTAGGGVTDIQPPAGKTTVGQLSPDEVRNMIATSYAGGLSEPGGTTPMHSSGDLAARKQVLGGRADTMWQGIQRLATGGTGGTDQMLQGGQQSAEAKARVTALLADPAVQKHIDNVTSHIASKGHLSGPEVREIIKNQNSVLTSMK